MSFEDALAACKRGAHISRAAWVRKKWISIEMDEVSGRWLAYRKDGLISLHPWAPLQVDLLAGDWEIRKG
jgi:hypothetical protein